MFYTFAYKQGYIHTKYVNGIEIVQVQVDQFAYIIQVKSVQAAKVLITKHKNNSKSL